MSFSVICCFYVNDCIWCIITVFICIYINSMGNRFVISRNYKYATECPDLTSTHHRCMMLLRSR